MLKIVFVYFGKEVVMLILGILKKGVFIEEGGKDFKVIIIDLLMI